VPVYELPCRGLIDRLTVERDALQYRNRFFGYFVALGSQRAD